MRESSSPDSRHAGGQHRGCGEARPTEDAPRGAFSEGRGDHMTSPWVPPVLRGEPCEVVITPQQANVLSGIACGHTNRQIARKLGIAENTVKIHVRRLYALLSARDRAH